MHLTLRDLVPFHDHKAKFWNLKCVRNIGFIVSNPDRGSNALEKICDDPVLTRIRYPLKDLGLKPTSCPHPSGQPCVSRYSGVHGQTHHCRKSIWRTPACVPAGGIGMDQILYNSTNSTIMTCTLSCGLTSWSWYAKYIYIVFNYKITVDDWRMKL